jgi:protein-S-isoprenylcysteine O-methyltransferase Ste14
MPLLLQPPFVAMLIAMTAGLIHSRLGPWPEVLCMPLIGGMLGVAGFTFMMWARMLFTCRGTTLFVGQEASQLVCDGPFRFSRNPMYIGVLVSLLGLALWIGTVPLYVAVPFTFMTFNFFHIPREEQRLRESFGERYLTYSKEVRRWL